jgi:hypothetical protein
VLIRGKSVEDWQDWVDQELSPPYGRLAETKQGREVLEAFRECLAKLGPERIGGKPVYVFGGPDVGHGDCGCVVCVEKRRKLSVASQG